VRAGNLDSARALLQDAQERFAALGADSLGAEVRVRRVELAVAEGDGTAALRLADHALALPALSAGANPLVAAAQRLRGQALQLVGRDAEAALAFSAAIETARGCRADYELALCIRAGTERDDPRRAEAEQILSRLGVRSAKDVAQVAPVP
jgi:hypothetical protein